MEEFKEFKQDREWTRKGTANGREEKDQPQMNADLRRWVLWSAAFPRPDDEAGGVWAEGRFEVQPVRRS